MSSLWISGGLRRPVTILASVGFVVTISLWYCAIRTPPIPQRTLFIGFEYVPPVQIRTAPASLGSRLRP